MCLDTSIECTQRQKRFKSNSIKGILLYALFYGRREKSHKIPVLAAVNHDTVYIFEQYL